MSKLFRIRRLHLIVFISAVFLAACGETSKAKKDLSEQAPGKQQAFNVTMVMADNLQFNDTDAGAMINFSSPEFITCSLTFIKANFKLGYKAQIAQLGKGEFDVTCTAATDHYVMTENGNTRASMEVVKLNQALAINLDFTLYGVKSKQLQTKENILLALDAGQLKMLQ